MEQADISELNASAEQVCGLLKALSHPARLLLLCTLTEGERCVSELEEETGIQQPTLSQQLGVLREEELVQTRRDGKQVFYTIASREALEVMRVLHKLYCGKGRKETRK